MTPKDAGYIRQKRIINFILTLLPIIIVWCMPIHVKAGENIDLPNKPTVYLIRIEGTIEPGLASYVKRVISEATRLQADAILIEVNTFGGRVDAATEIRDLIIRFPGRSIAYVTGRAWSAGALITLAAENIAMAKTASIGAAETIPKEEKQISALRGEFEATAENRGRDSKIAAAMVDSDIVIEGLVDSGKLLTLTAKKGKELGFIDFIGSSRDEVLSKFGLEKAKVYEPIQNWAEKLARFLTDPTVSSLLLTLGFLGIVFEVMSPGWGIAGTLGILALILFFGGRLVIGLAGWSVIGLFILGFALLLIEAFIIPGFGITGISGIIAVLTSLVLSFRNIKEASFAISFAMILSILIIVIMAKRIRKSKLFGRLILKTAEHISDGYIGIPARKDYIGKIGYSLTYMRPSGTVMIGDERVDAVTEGVYLEAGSKIEVIRVEGPRLIVRAYGPDSKGGNEE